MKLKKELSNRKLNKVSDEINSKGFSIIKLFSKMILIIFLKKNNQEFKQQKFNKLQV